MKFIFFLLLFSNNVFSQNTFYEYVEFTLYNSQGEKIENATVLVDRKIVPFDSIRQSYFLVDSIKINFNVSASCDGYEPISYSRENLDGTGSSFFRCFFHLKRPSEKFYYWNNWLKVPYQPHPNQLLVILKTESDLLDYDLLIRFENKIQQKGMIIKPDFPQPPTNIEEEWELRGIVGLNSRIIIEKEDGSDFDSDYCEELAFLRSLDEVSVAGPFIQMGNKYNIVTYENKISLYQFGDNYNFEGAKKRSQEINQLVKQVDERYYFDEKTREIILPLETNEIVPQIMEKFREIGIRDRMMMEIHFMMWKD